ncbi:MAG TPA: zinc metalloprotease HtpX [Solirubrobacteraceae bacterium]|nr:zinc metalloprotease HtpX [Solirubrobacteraceae bacterium]
MASRSSNFGRDTGLQTRMVATMFLLGLVYAVLIGVLVASGAGGVTIAIIAGALFVLQLTTSDKIGLRVMGAHEVSPQDEPEFHAIVERLCVQANLPKPRLAIIETSMPNACAMGRSQKSATVCLTTGIQQLLSPAELEGVLAHELTHVINRDVMVMTIASFFASVASMIVQFGFFFGGGFGGGGDDDEDNSIMYVILVSVVVYAVSFVLMQALSRYREFAADRGAAVITGRPSALASALLKIGGTMERVPQQDLRAAEGMSAFFIFPARTKRSLYNLFADHPPIEQRVAALGRLETQLQGVAA